MSAVSRPRRRGLSVILTLVALFIAAPAANAAQNDPVIQAPVAGGTYLALGDSLAFGYQAAKVLALSPTGCTTPDSTSTPATSTTTPPRSASRASTPSTSVARVRRAPRCINATNATTGLHDVSVPDPLEPPRPDAARGRGRRAADGRQEGLADHDRHRRQRHARRRARCTAHGRRDQPELRPAARPAVFATINANLDSTLNTLRQEGGVKHEIIVVGLYNVLYPAIFQQVAGSDRHPAQAAAAGGTERPARDPAELAAGRDRREVPRGVRRSVAGVQPAGRPAPARDRLDLHEDRGLRSAANDIHPTDGGYADLANVVDAADGF